MSDQFQQQSGNEELWQTIFGPGHPDLNKQHRLHAMLPREPRCKLCFAPFKGLGGFYLRFKGKGRSNRNPNFCNACDGFLEAFPGGAEVDMSVIFVDIRNSTQFAETAEPAAVSGRINSFLDAVTDVIVKADGFILAFYGDCVVAVWPPGFSGPDHAAKALGAARALTNGIPVKGADGAPIPFGVGLHSGPIYIGTVQAARGLFRDVSIFGHGVNLTARLAAGAQAGEALLSAEMAQAAGIQADTLPKRELELKGISEKTAVYSLT